MAPLKEKILSWQPAYGPLLLVVALFSLASAYTAEYGFGLKPCELCLYQRIPYAVVAVLGLVMLALRKNQKIAWLLLVLSAAVFAAGAALAFFHVGVEQHWWKGLEGCSGGAIANTIEDLRAQIMGAPVVRCDQPAFVFLGISMAGYNVLWSGALAAVSGYAALLSCQCKKK